jgi:hypothetical protein
MEQVLPRPRDRARASAHPSEASAGPRVRRGGKTWLVAFVLVVVPLGWVILLLWGVTRLALLGRAAALEDLTAAWWTLRNALRWQRPRSGAKAYL